MAADCEYSLVDLTLPLSQATPVFPGDPEITKSWHVVNEATGCRVGKIGLGLHSGTHVDAPLHIFQSGLGVDGMSLSLFCGSAQVVHAPKGEGQRIEKSDVQDIDIRPGDIVLFRTGWEERANTPKYFVGEWPGFSEEAVRLLIRRGAKAIGGDIPSADSPSGSQAGLLAHKCALGAGMPIFEALVNLDCVVGTRVFFIALPLKIVEGDGSPVRAVALVSKEAFMWKHDRPTRLDRSSPV